MIRILDKATICRLILPHLSTAKRGFVCRTHLAHVVNAILYKFKTGVQWKFLPVAALIPGAKIKYGAVFHHFRKWAKDGSWAAVRRAVGTELKGLLDLSLAFFDGTHTPAARGGKGVGYQRRKRRKTTNTLWLCDRNGLIVSYLPPTSGNHNDLYDIERAIRYLIDDLRRMHIPSDGLFINADAGFDASALRHLLERFGIHLNAPVNPRRGRSEEEWYFDEMMYEERYKIERTNAWMDANRTFATRYDTTLTSWIAWHDIQCIKSWCRAASKV